MEGKGSTDRRAGSHHPLFYRRPPPVEAVFGGTEDARGAKGERTAAAVLTSIYAAGGSLIPFPFSYSTLTSIALPPFLTFSFSLSLSLSFSLLPFLYLIDGVFIYLRRLFRCRCRGHTFVVVCEALNGYFRLSFSLRINNIVTA